MNAGYGLTVRWSLENAPNDAADQLREYVVGTSIARFMFLDGLAFKVWRMREGEWFEGTYVFDTEQDRKLFREDFEPDAAAPPAAGSSGPRRSARGLGGRGDRRGTCRLPPRGRSRRAAERPGGSALDGHEQAVADRQQRRDELVVVAQRLAEVAQGARRGVARRRVGHLVVPEHVVHDEHARPSAAAEPRARRRPGSRPCRRRRRRGRRRRRSSAAARRRRAPVMTRVRWCA